MPDPENLLLTGASVEISAAAKTPTINVLAYSGGLMNVPGWGTVVIDLAGLDLSSPQVSLLADHDASLKGIVGHGQAVVRDGKLLVMGTLADATDAAKQIIALAKTGFAFQASVGVSPIERGIFAGPSIVGSGIPAWNFVRKLHIGKDLRSSAMP